MAEQHDGAESVLAVDDAAVQHGLACLQTLHRRPETAGCEEWTAGRVAEWLRSAGAEVSEGWGGTGVVGWFEGARSGPRYVLRCELDGLAIAENTDLAYASERPGYGHLCGHDGHMAILLAVAQVLGPARLRRGAIGLLFQPAEETGAGAAAVLNDPRFEDGSISSIFALHNLPGMPLGQVVVRAGTFCCASTGLRIVLRGRAGHAAQPEAGSSPALALARLISEIERLGPTRDDPCDFATVVGARLGSEAYGTSPGEAELFVTLRGETNSAVDALLSRILEQVAELASASGLTWRHECRDTFSATRNHQGSVEPIERAAVAAGLDVVRLEQPLRWSEDFGRFLDVVPGALFGLGTGEQAPPLHDPEYVFPPELIRSGAELWLRLLESLP